MSKRRDKNRKKHGGLTRNQQRKKAYALMINEERGNSKGKGKRSKRKETKEVRARLHILKPCGNIACERCYPTLFQEKLND